MIMIKAAKETDNPTTFKVVACLNLLNALRKFLRIVFISISFIRWSSMATLFYKNRYSDKLVHRRDDATIEQVDDPVGETGIVLGVRHHDDRISPL